jgi:transposase
VKSVDQQAVLALHRVRALLVRQRTQIANAVRGLLGEFGIVVAKGIRRLPELRDELRERMAATTEGELPDDARAAVGLLFKQLEAIQGQLDAAEAAIVAWHRRSEASPRLATAPGIGPITATALVAAVGDARQFASARHFAAWLRLTPRMRASGGKTRGRSIHVVLLQLAPARPSSDRSLAARAGAIGNACRTGSIIAFDVHLIN